MVKDCKPSVHRVLGRSYAYDPVHSNNKQFRAQICGSLIAVDSLEGLAYIQVPRDTTNSAQSSISGKHDVTSYDQFAEPQKGKSRSKPVVSLAISGDGTWLACGEQGQAPLLCLWSLPLCDREPRFIINVHRYGIKLLAFSPDNRYLASVGYMHDAGIHVWDLQDECRMIFTNRVNAKLHDMKWINNNKIITCGVRHVRLWQLSTAGADHYRSNNVQQASTGVLDGRNVILGPLVHSEFLSICIDRQNNVYLATSHEICVYTTAGIGSLTQICHSSTAIDKISVTDGTLVMRQVDRSSHLLQLVSQDDSDIPQGDKKYELRETHTDPSQSRAFESASSHALPHLQGVSSVLDCVISDENCVAFTSECEAVYFDKTGNQLRRSVSPRRPVTALAAISAELLVIGSFSGQVSLFDHVQNIECAAHLAHTSEVVCIKHDPATDLVATSGRDRTIQLFSLHRNVSELKLVLYQTLDEHTGNVNDVVFMVRL